MHELIKNWRIKSGMTQAQLAEKLFMTPQAVSLIENGKRTIQYSLFEKIAAIFEKEIIFYTCDKPYLKPLNEELLQHEVIPEFTEKIGLIHIDEEDVRHVFSTGPGYFAKSQNIVLEEALDNLFFRFKDEKTNLNKATSILIQIEGPNNFSFDHFDLTSEELYKYISKEANVIVGCRINDTESHGFTVRLMAAGY
jgi:transcriptional regulator with XRE-family HTH domain